MLPGDHHKSISPSRAGRARSGYLRARGIRSAGSRTPTAVSERQADKARPVLAPWLGSNPVGPRFGPLGCGRTLLAWACGPGHPWQSVAGLKYAGFAARKAGFAGRDSVSRRQDRAALWRSGQSGFKYGRWTKSLRDSRVPTAWFWRVSLR
jgi:hypothetical protein